MNANRSWNLACVASGICLAAFIAFVTASACGWHPAATARAAVASALAVVACVVWLQLSAVRFGPLEPEPDDDEEAGTP